MPHDANVHIVEMNKLAQITDCDCEKIHFCDGCKMDTDHDNMTIIEMRALVRVHGLRSYTRFRKAGLIAFL